jgi:23S rRNA (guanosine2251-2'-O)-methyltransferase
MEIIMIVHNVRSAQNVGSLLRSADGFGVKKVFFTGYTPFPMTKADNRPPHTAQKVHKKITKTSLGAENSVLWQHQTDVFECLNPIKQQGFTIVALEQSKGSVDIRKYKPARKLALIVGNEVSGIEKEVIEAADIVLEIPMDGTKESLNVSVAGAIALYHLKYYRVRQS